MTTVPLGLSGRWCQAGPRALLVVCGQGAAVERCTRNRSQRASLREGTWAGEDLNLSLYVVLYLQNSVLQTCRITISEVDYKTIVQRCSLVLTLWPCAGQRPHLSGAPFLLGLPLHSHTQALCRPCLLAHSMSPSKSPAQPQGP